MYFLPTFFEFFENKRLFASKRILPARAGVFSRHNLWYTVFVFVPDMVQTIIYRRENPPLQRFSSFLYCVFFLAAAVFSLSSPRESSHHFFD
jgi:hypothetical protein